MRSIAGAQGRQESGRGRLGTAVLAGMLLAGHVHIALAQSVPLVIRSLSFSGNRAFTGDSLSTYLITTHSARFARVPILRGIFGQRRTLDERDFRGDVHRLATFYRASGYMGVKIDTVVKRTAKDVWITFRIVEGPPVRVGQLSIPGLDSVEHAAQVRLDLPLEAGGAFSGFRGG